MAERERGKQGDTVLEIPSDKGTELWDQLLGTATKTMDLSWHLYLNKKKDSLSRHFDIADKSSDWAGQLEKILQVSW